MGMAPCPRPGFLSISTFWKFPRSYHQTITSKPAKVWGLGAGRVGGIICLRLSLASEAPASILDQPHLAAQRQYTGPLPSSALSLEAVPFMGL